MFRQGGKPRTKSDPPCLQNQEPSLTLHASPDRLLAAQASLLGEPGGMVTIATTNVGHLARFPGVHAEPWPGIT